MRKPVTFIVRLWVDAQADPTAWEGRVECVADGAHGHVWGPEELARFIAAHVGPAGTPRQEEPVEKIGGNQ